MCCPEGSIGLIKLTYIKYPLIIKSPLFVVWSPVTIVDEDGVKKGCNPMKNIKLWLDVLNPWFTNTLNS